MRKAFAIGLAFLVLTASGFAEEGFGGRPITNSLWMPTGYTLNQGEFTVGIGSIGFGITDNVQVGTNVLLYLFQYNNGNAKVNLVELPDMALAAGVHLGHFNLDLSDDPDDEITFTSLSPYLSFSRNLTENTDLHLAGQLTHFSADVEIEDAEVEWSSTGTSVSGGLEYSLTHRTKFLAETGYDFTFEGLRVGGGVLFGWEKFRLKLGVGYYNPKGVSGGFTLPVIGLWWRFMG